MVSYPVGATPTMPQSPLYEGDFLDTAHRLSVSLPALAAAFHQASWPKRSAAARVAVEHAVTHTQLQGDEVLAAMQALRQGSAPPPGLRARLEALAATLDEAAFEAAERGETEHLPLFSSARAAAALAYALSDDDTLHEAIYEATMAVEAPDALVQAVERALRAP